MIQFTDEVQDILSETIAESATDSNIEDPQACESDVFEKNDNFKKYHSALCLPRCESNELLKNMQAAFNDTSEEEF